MGKMYYNNRCVRTVPGSKKEKLASIPFLVSRKKKKNEHLSFLDNF